MTTVEGSSTDLESIVSNGNRPAPSGADRAVDPADAGSVLGGGGGAQPLGGGPRLASVDDRWFIGGAGSVRDQAGAGSVRDQAGAGSVRDQAGAGSVRDQAGAGSVRDQAGAGSVRDQAGAGSVHSGARSIENDDQPVDNNDVRRSFRREIGRPIFDNSRPVITGKKITNRTWIKRKKMTHLSFSERAVWGTVVTINRAKHYAFIRRCGKMMTIQMLFYFICHIDGATVVQTIYSFEKFRSSATSTRRNSFCRILVNSM